MPKLEKKASAAKLRAAYSTMSVEKQRKKSIERKSGQVDKKKRSLTSFMFVAAVNIFYRTLVHP